MHTTSSVIPMSQRMAAGPLLSWTITRGRSRSTGYRWSRGSRRSFCPVVTTTTARPGFLPMAARSPFGIGLVTTAPIRCGLSPWESPESWNWWLLASSTLRFSSWTPDGTSLVLALRASAGGAGFLLKVDAATGQKTPLDGSWSPCDGWNQGFSEAMVMPGRQGTGDVGEMRGAGPPWPMEPGHFEV